MTNATLKTSSSNNRGFTLLEVMVAMMITLLGLLGLLQSVNIATEHNVKNQMREEALQIAEESLANLRVRPFARLSTTAENSPTPGWAPKQITGRLLGLDKKYILTRWATNMPNSDAVELRVRVGWSYKNISSNHEVRTVRSQ